MLNKIATIAVICETLILIIGSVLLATPKDTVLKLGDVINLKYKIVLVER